jgi:hypothetical protein
LRASSNALTWDWARPSCLMCWSHHEAAAPTSSVYSSVLWGPLGCAVPVLPPAGPGVKGVACVDSPAPSTLPAFIGEAKPADMVAEPLEFSRQAGGMNEGSTFNYGR